MKLLEKIRIFLGTKWIHARSHSDPGAKNWSSERRERRIKTKQAAVYFHFSYLPSSSGWKLTASKLSAALLFTQIERVSQIKCINWSWRRRFSSFSAVVPHSFVYTVKTEGIKKCVCEIKGDILSGGLNIRSWLWRLSDRVICIQTLLTESMKQPALTLSLSHSRSIKTLLKFSWRQRERMLVFGMRGKLPLAPPRMCNDCRRRRRCRQHQWKLRDQTGFTAADARLFDE